MAKVTGPLFSVDASGKLADSLVFTKWRGINTVRQYSKPSNPQTEGQMEVRNNFSASVSDWQSLAGPDKEAWGLSATGKPQSGFNLFVKSSVQTKMQYDDFNLLSDGYADPTAGADATEAEVSITPQYGGTARVLYGNQPDRLLNEVELTLTAETESSVMLTDLMDGQEYYFKIKQDVETVEEQEVSGETGIYQFMNIT